MDGPSINICDAGGGRSSSRHHGRAGDSDSRTVALSSSAAGVGVGVGVDGVVPESTEVPPRERQQEQQEKEGEEEDETQQRRRQRQGRGAQPANKNFLAKPTDGIDIVGTDGGVGGRISVGNGNADCPTENGEASPLPLSAPLVAMPQTLSSAPSARAEQRARAVPESRQVVAPGGESLLTENKETSALWGRARPRVRFYTHQVW